MPYKKRRKSGTSTGNTRSSPSNLANSSSKNVKSSTDIGILDPIGHRIPENIWKVIKIFKKLISGWNTLDSILDREVEFRTMAFEIGGFLDSKDLLETTLQSGIDNLLNPNEWAHTIFDLINEQNKYM